jgi:HPt (histidine-containing phosphotransfer) domain-containing protein
VDLDPQQLKEKALLLLQRERELFELRNKHVGLAVWLALAQSLPQMIADARLGFDEIYAQLRKSMTTSLRIQRILFFEVGATLLRPLAPAGPARPLQADAMLTIDAERFGMVNDASEGNNRALAETLGLEKFIWSRIDIRGRPPVLLAAGYDKAKAKFFPAFDEGTSANLQNTAQHIEALLGNAVLLSQIQDERDRLKQMNDLLKVRDAELSAMACELRAANERLEQKVAARTQELEQRNRDMRLVLDNVSTALLTVDASGRLAAERSAKVDEWFGSYQGTPRFVDYIAASDPTFAQWFELGHETLVQRTMPQEVCLRQLPDRLRAKGRIGQCTYRMIGNPDDDFGLLITVEDITERQRLEQEEAEQRELLAFCTGLTSDRAGFLTFFDEADRLVREIAGKVSDVVVHRRNIHTLKGSAALMGANVLSELCHRAEEELAEDGSKATEIIALLVRRWATITQTIEPVLGEGGRNIVEIPGVEFDRLCRDVDQGMTLQELRLRLQRLTFEPIERPLGRLARFASSLGHRLGKPDIVVVINTEGALMDPRRLRRLWTTLVHVVRNAVDHGIEPPLERLARGKSANGQLTFRAVQTSHELALDIEDDGRGIDWAQVDEVARARGLAHESEADLVRALLSDGFTTKCQADSTSGRGVGLSAVSQTVAELGGTLSLKSRPGRGATWSIVLPLMPAEGYPARQTRPRSERVVDG